MIVARRGHDAAVGAETDTAHRGPVSLESHKLDTLQGPELDRIIFARGSQHLAIRAETDIPHIPPVPGQTVDLGNPGHRLLQGSLHPGSELFVIQGPGISQ